MSLSLREARDQLAPRLAMRTWAPIESLITIDEKSDNLLVKAHNPENKRDLGFAITRKAIVDGTYKTEFDSAVETLMELLKKETLTKKEMKGLGL